MDEQKIYSKDELMSEMYRHYELQKELCELKYTDAMGVEKNPELHAACLNSKKGNVTLREYNQQVYALSRTISTLILLQKSQLPDPLNENETSNDDELIE